MGHTSAQEESASIRCDEKAEEETAVTIGEAPSRHAGGKNKGECANVQQQAGRKFYGARKIKEERDPGKMKLGGSKYGTTEWRERSPCPQKT